MQVDGLERLCAKDADPLLAVSTAVVVAHPDDETIGLGGRLPHLRGAVLIHVTDGAPRDLRDARAAGFATREQYAQARREELRQALAVAGIEMCQERMLDFIDQEASLDLVALAERLADIFQGIDPSVVLTHPYEGGHPDHDATAFAVHAACRLLEREHLMPPAILEFTSYHDCNGRICTGDFLSRVDVSERKLVLAETEREHKRRMIECFATQQKMLQQFAVEAECFRPAPRYDFTHPPHAGRLHYERLNWDMTGTRWCALANEANHQLGLDE